MIYNVRDITDGKKVLTLKSLKATQIPVLYTMWQVIKLRHNFSHIKSKEREHPDVVLYWLGRMFIPVKIQYSQVACYMRIRRCRVTDPRFLYWQSLLWGSRTHWNAQANRLPGIQCMCLCSQVHLAYIAQSH